MINGFWMLEYYVLDYDVIVVIWILDVGGIIIGKVVCEEWCFIVISCIVCMGFVVNFYNEMRMVFGFLFGLVVLVSLFVLLD